MTPNAGKDVELSLVVGMQNGAAFLEDCLAGSYKINIFLHAIQNLFLGIYPKGLKTYVYTKTGTKMFIAALVIKRQHLEATKTPLVGNG